MKPRHSFRRWFFAVVILPALCVSPRLAAAPSDATDFPYPLVVALGSTEFAPGDSIVITSLRGNRPHLEAGGRYLLEGNYVLASAEDAQLSWFNTSRGPSAPTRIHPDQTTAVKRGAGTFRLIKSISDDGWPHVSFYVGGQSHGGVYFGEAGFEHTVLRTKSWSDFTPRTPRTSAPSSFTVGRGMGTGSPAGSPNEAIMAYLGEPVAPPANLEPGLKGEALMATFRTLVKNAGGEVVKLAVDESEFPFLLYGAVTGDGTMKEIQKALNSTAGYAYSGSITGRGSPGTTNFSLNMTPSNRYASRGVHRRLMVRLQMLADKAQRAE